MKPPAGARQVRRSLITIAMLLGFARAATAGSVILLGAVAGTDYLYRLPYADRISYEVLQGYGSRLSHRGTEYYTVDFRMPEGTLVYSARDGTVIAAEDEFDMSCWAEECAQFANFVQIRHADGTIAKYFHLQRGSVLVTVGQQIARGQPIARSGDTGIATGPHLHFGVYRKTAGGTEQSVAIPFAVRDGVISRPRAGARYFNAAD
jgi:murein DD-endopeptidase MepM/ murein hydrolase activator NlpD